MKIGEILETFASPNTFEVYFSNNKLLAKEATVYCKSVNLPDRELKSTDFFYDGVKYPIAREVAYKNTTEMTFYMSDSGNREAFIKWMELGRRLRHNVKISNRVPKGDKNDFYMTVKIEHKGGYENRQTAGVYTFYHMFPTDVSAVTLSNDSGSLPEFTVTFAYSTWDSKLVTPKRQEAVSDVTKAATDKRGLAGFIDDFIASW